MLHVHKIMHRNVYTLQFSSCCSLPLWYAVPHSGIDFSSLHSLGVWIVICYSSGFGGLKGVEIRLKFVQIFFFFGLRGSICYSGDWTMYSKLNCTLFSVLGLEVCLFVCVECSCRNGFVAGGLKRLWNVFSSKYLEIQVARLDHCIVILKCYIYLVLYKAPIAAACDENSDFCSSNSCASFGSEKMLQAPNSHKWKLEYGLRMNIHYSVFFKGLRTKTKMKLLLFVSEKGD